jgi:hypothetical protein
MFANLNEGSLFKQSDKYTKGIQSNPINPIKDDSKNI